MQSCSSSAGLRLWFLLMLLSSSCAGSLRGVVGPGRAADGASFALGLHAAGRFDAVSYRTPTGIQTLTPPLAAERWGLEDEWTLVEYHRDEGPHEPVRGEVVRDITRVDGRAGVPRLGEMIAAARADAERDLLARVPSLRAALTTPREASPMVSLLSVAWPVPETIRIELAIHWAVVEQRMPCGGIARPDMPVAVAGFAWERTYDLDRTGRITSITSSEVRPITPPEPCDPRLARSPGPD